MTVDPLGTFRNQLTHGIGGSSSRRRRRAGTVGVVTLAIVAIVGAWLVAARPDNKEVVVADGPSSARSGDSPGGSMDGSPLDDSRCEITQPTEPGLAAPDGWPEHPPTNDVWYGTADLWTVLPVDGSSPAGRKSVWWSAKFPGGSVEPTPDIDVIWQRLDKPAALVRSNRGNSAFIPDHGWFMIAGIDPPSAGCWKVTASYRGATLSYVYWNPPRLWVQPLPTAPNSGTSGIEGQVGFDEINNCYFLERDGLRLPVVWPAGTTVSRNGSIITLADGSTIRLGDHIAGAGGYHQVEEQLEPTIPTECVPTTGEVAVFNADAKLS